MPLKLITSGGGSVILDANTTGSTFTLTAPARNGTLITTGDSGTVTQGMLGNGVSTKGPTFYAYGLNATTLLVNADKQITLNAELWDTDNYFDTSTNRFTPLIAGYYQINAGVRADIGSNPVLHCKVRKNGSDYSAGNFINISNGQQMTHVSTLVYLNGTTDYVDLSVFSSTAGSTSPGQSTTYMNGFLARGA